MFSGFINSLFSNEKPLSNTSQAKRKRLRGRICRIEELEERELLSVTLGDFSTIKSQYTDLNLTNFADYNFIEVGGTDPINTTNSFAFSDAGIRAAINRAGVTSQNDIIVVRTTATQNKITLGGTELVININAATRGTVTIVSLGTADLTIDANQKSRVFNIGSTATAALAGLTITNGQVSTSVSGNDITIADAYGGGIYNGGTLAVSYCTISANSTTATASSYYPRANAHGGGIYNSGTLTVSNSMISANLATANATTTTGYAFSGTATANADAYGGGIYSSGTLTVLNSTISANSATANGTHNGYARAYAYAYGGGIHSNGTLTNCVIVANSATATSTYALNTPGYGGGSYGGAKLINCTIAGNSAKSGGGGIFNASVVANTIVALNSGEDTSGSFTGNNNLIGYNSSQPLFVNAAGGDYRLAFGSQAIDKGSNTLIPAGITTDILGIPRIMNDTVDIGAYEYASELYPIVVTSLSDSARPTDGISLRQAIVLAGTHGLGMFITFAPSLHGKTITLGSELYIDKNITIDAVGANITINANQKSRGFNIASGAVVTLAGLTITNGQASNGGGIYNDGSLTLLGCLIAGNTSSYGGGIYNVGSLTAANCTIAGNSGTYGVGIYRFSGTIELYNTIVVQNANTNIDLNFGTIFGCNNLTANIAWATGSTGNFVYDSALPLFVNAATGDFHLITGSQAINKGNNIYVPEWITKDLAGNARIIHGTVDIGAYEYDEVVPPIMPPIAPVDFRSTAQTENSVMLEWDFQDGLTSYTLEYKKSTDLEWSTWTAPATNAESATITGLTADTTYTFQLTATNGSGSATSTTNATTQPPEITKLPIPTLGDITATSSNAIFVTWSPVTNANGYRVECSTSSTFAGSFYSDSSTSTTSTTITVSSANTLYYVRIVALGNGTTISDSDPSSAKSATTLCNAPSGLMSLTQTTTSVSLSWTAPVGGAASYRVERSANGASDWMNIFTGGMIISTDWQDASLIPNTTYYYRVYAVNSAGDFSATAATGNFTTAEEIVTPGLTAPNDVTIITTDTTENSVTLTWTLVDGASGYEVQYRSSTTGQWHDLNDSIEISGEKATITVNSLDSNQQYQFQVRAVNGDGNSEWSDEVFATTLCNSPTNLTSPNQTSTGVSLSWSAPTGGATSYQVQRSNNGTSDWTTIDTITDTTYVDNSLTPNTTYYYRVYAVNSTGDLSTTAATSTVKTKPESATKLDTPTGITATSKNATTITVNWNAVTNASWYIVEYATDANFTHNWTWGEWDVLGGMTQSVDITNLTTGTKYYFRVIACRNSGITSEFDSNPSVTVDATPSIVTTGYNVLDWNKVEAAKANNGLIEGQAIWTEINGEYRLTEISRYRNGISGLTANLSGDLDLSGCDALVSVWVRGTRLTSLDVSGCTALEFLRLDSTRITTLDVSDCTALESLSLLFGSNQLTMLDLSTCTALNRVRLGTTPLTYTTVTLPVGFQGTISKTFVIDTDGAIERTNFNELASFHNAGGGTTTYTWYSGGGEELDWGLPGKIWEEVDEIDPSLITNVNGVFSFDHSLAGKHVYCKIINSAYGNWVITTSYIKLDASDLPHNAREKAMVDYLKNFEIIDEDGNSNLLAEWEYDSNSNEMRLIYLGLRGGEAWDIDIFIESLDFSGFDKLLFLGFDGIGLMNLDVSGCTALQFLECWETSLTSLDVSGCLSLEGLSIGDNNGMFTALKVNLFQSFGNRFELYCPVLTTVDVIIPASLPVNGTLDLSGSPLIGNIPTDFIWYYADGTLVPQNFFINDNGRFTFHGLAEGTKIYCEMTNNANFDGLTLRTTIITTGTGQEAPTPGIISDKTQIDKTLATIKGVKLDKKDSKPTLTSLAFTWTPATTFNADEVTFDVWIPKTRTIPAQFIATATITLEQLNALTIGGEPLTIHSGDCTITITAKKNSKGKNYLEVKVSGLNAGTKYTVEMQTKSGENGTPYSKVTKISASTAKYTAVKSLKKTTVGLYSVALNWKEPAKVPGNPTTSYVVKVYLATDKKLVNPIESLTQSVTNLGTTIEGLSANTKYTFVVQAVADELGIVSAIAKISAATINPAKYPAASGFKATVDKNTNAVTLSWKESKVPDTTHYEVVVRDAAGEERKFDVVPGVSGVTVSDKGVITIPPITDLELGKYTILVRAVTAEGIKSVKDAKKVVTLK